MFRVRMSVSGSCPSAAKRCYPRRPPNASSPPRAHPQAMQAARLAAPAAGLLALSYGASPARASGDILAPAEYSWSHSGPLSVYDASRCVCCPA